MPPLQLDHFFSDRQTQTITRQVANITTTMKRLEDFRLFVNRNPNSAICYLKDYLFVIAGDSQLNSAIGGGIFDCVTEQVY